jgi:hypothetical protein
VFHHSVVISSPTWTGGGIRITGGDFTLIQRGLSQLAFTDSLGSTIVPDTVTSSDTSKATVTNGGLLTGVGTSGTTVITAAKAGYASGTITVTSSGGHVMDLIASSGTSTTTDTNPVTSWIDRGSGAQTWAEAVFSPTYLASGSNGQPALLFDGTTQFISSPSTTAYNVAGSDSFEWICLRTTSDGGATNRNLTTHYEGSAVFRGMQFLATTGNVARCQYGSSSASRLLDNPSANLLAAAPHYLAASLFSVGSNTQRLYMDGVSVATDTVAYRDNNAAIVHRMGVTQTLGSNYAGQEVYWRGKTNRALTATELAQMFLAMKTLLGL